MAAPKTHRKNETQVVRLDSLNDIRFGTPAHPPTYAPPRTTVPHTPPPSTADSTFEQYQAANLNVVEKHNLIGKLRDEMSIMDRDEVDELTLRDLGTVLERCIFPTCKMMQISPVAVKRMLDDHFRRAYGLEVEADVLAKLGLGRLGDFDKAVVVREQDAAIIEARPEDVEGGTVVRDGVGQVETPISSAPLPPPPSKKIKSMPLVNARKEIKAYVTRRKRGRHGVKVVCLRSQAVCEKWLGMEGVS